MKAIGRLIFRISLIPLLFFSCGKTGEPKLVTAESLPPSEKLTPDTRSIQRNVVDVKCLRCHDSATSSNRYVDLRDINELIEGQKSDGREVRKKLVKPGCPQQSFFLSIMKERKMPPSQSERLDAETLKIIEDWIYNLNPEASTSCNSDEPPD